jgi:hypothetical protein
MKRHRERSSEAFGELAPRGAKSEGAEAGGTAAEQPPQLSRELDDRCLTVGTGDRDDDVGLATEEARREKGEGALRVVVHDDGDTASVPVGSDPGRAEDRHRAPSRSLADVSTAVLSLPHQGHEHPPRLDGLPVGRDPAHLDISRLSGVACRERTRPE